MMQPYDKLGDLLAHLAQDGQEEQALALAQSLCRRLSRAQTPFDVRQCEQILRKKLSLLVVHDCKAALEVFCDVLDTSVNHFESSGNASSYTWSWRAAIEDHGQNTPNGFHGPRDILVSLVRDATKLAVEQCSVPMEEVVLLLERRPGRIFRRLALYILSLFPDTVPNLVAERLTDRTLFDDPDCHHEYTLLSHAGFAHLSKEEQDTMLGWIESGPDVQAYKAFYEKQMGKQPTDELLADYTNHWQRDWLARLGPDLPPEWQQRYESLVCEYGPAEHPEFVSYMSTAWAVAPASTLSREDLRAMSVEEIISYLKSWQPSPSSSEDFMNPLPSREGLGHMLTNAIEEEPERFAQKARQFRGIDATYVSAVLAGFENAARQKRSFPWLPVLDLCFWVIQRQVKPTKRKRVAPDLVKQWASARKSIIHLLSLGFESGSVEIPIDLHLRVWEVLQPLTEDEDPTPEHEARYSGPTMEPFTLAMNTIRGEAMEAAIRYAMWFRRHKEQEAQGQQGIALGLDEMPYIQDVLKRHLDPQHDPSLAIRSVYGRLFPQFVLLDSPWATEQVPKIFSTEQTNSHLRDAAWEAYIIFNPPYNNIFDILSEEYARAVELIGTLPTRGRNYYDPDQRLAEHLITLYCRGKVEIDEPQGILSRFFTNAPEVLRKHMLTFVGRDLYSVNQTKQTVLPDAIPRLQALWEWRVNRARQASSPASHTNELAAFGWWFSSGMFDEDWAIAQLEGVLKISGTLEALHLVIGRFVTRSATMPLPVVRCVSLLTQSDRERWRILGSNEQIRTILMNALQSSDEQVIEEATDLTNRLILYGYTHLLDLLA